MSLKVGKAISSILSGAKIGEYTVKTHYGDQFELNKWVGIQNSSSKATKYPLVYYALNKHYKERNGWVSGRITLILLTTGVYSELNDKRLRLNYDAMLYPLADLVENLLTTNKNVIIKGSDGNQFTRIDEPLMGISSDNFEKLRSESKSVTTDVVDALILEFEADINIDCL